MKKPLILAGLLSAGALFVQQSEAQTVLNNLMFGQETVDLENIPPDKNWKIEASVKGFYDDNINTTPSGVAGKQESWGMEIMPIGTAGINTGQFEAAVGYGYNMKYYENRSNSADHRHLAGCAHLDADAFRPFRTKELGRIPEPAGQEPAPADQAHRCVGDRDQQQPARHEDQLAAGPGARRCDAAGP